MTNVSSERLQRLVGTVRSKLGEQRYQEVAHYLEVNEWPLALRMLAEYVDENDEKLSEDEWLTFKQLAAALDLDPKQFWYLGPGSE